MSYLLNNPLLVGGLLLRHLQMTTIALAVGFAVALPLGSLIHHYRRLASPVLSVLGVIYTIPSLALIILFIPWLGLNPVSVIAALILYAQVILVRNVAAGLGAIDPAMMEISQGLGMNAWQSYWRVQFPLALPVILAGVRIAAVTAIGIAAIGAKFGAGGLGVLLFDGIAQSGRYDKIWAGAIALGALATVVNQGLIWAERKAQGRTRAA
jgi:osmoprotectant transport system permease protein